MSDSLVVMVLGTDVHRFDRAVEWLDRWLADQPQPAPRCIVQHGSAAAPRLAEGRDFLDHAELQRLMAEATVVVAHGGPATITEARRTGHLPIVVPRDPGRDEHVDDHQQRFARRLDEAGLVHVCETEEALRATLDRAVADPDAFAVATPEEAADGTAPVNEAVRAVGRVVDGLTAARRRSWPRRRRRPRRDLRVLFVGGLGRSGSTLVDRMLAQMPDVASVGELVHIWERAVRDDERCGCGEAFSACPFWQKVGQLAFGGWENIDVDEVLRLKALADRTRFVPALALPRLSARRRADVVAYTSYFAAIYAAVREVSGCDVVVDSSKHASLAFALRWAHEIDLRVLHLVRDARGVAYSWSKRVLRPEVVGDEQYMTQYSPAEVGVLWTAQNAAFGVLDATGVPVLRLRYEDVLRDPGAALARLRRHADLGERADALDFLGAGGIDLDVDHTVAGNPMRFQTGHVPLRADDEWRTKLPRGHRRLVSVLTLPLRLRYGYLR
ncbi:MAG: Sulfotransferase family protein [Cryptosporangiaceae bacterium]|nr:Sulfotransferase family protein [Cryptosporangiaceae bacterium]